MANIAFRGLLLAGLLVHANLCSAADQDPGALLKVKSWYEPAEPMKIVGPVHYVGTQGLGVYLITTSEGHILLFGAMDESAELIDVSIRKLGFKTEDIKIMLTCHAHRDHVGTHAHFKAASHATVAMMAEEVVLLESGGKTDFHYGSVPAFNFPPTAVDRVLRDGDRVKLGDVSLTAHHTPGHTKGGTSWSMNVTENGKTYLVVFPDGTNVNPGYRLVRQLSYPGIADDYRRTFHTLEMLNPDIWLHSHTNFFDFEAKRARVEKEGANAWVDPEGYRKFIVDRRNIFEARIDAEMTEPDICDHPWLLASFTGPDGQASVPADKSKHTVEFFADGRVAVRADINRGRGSWKLGGWNEILLEPLALTKALNPPGPINDRFPKDWTSLKRFELKDGHLILSLADNAGRYEFEPMPAPEK